MVLLLLLIMDTQKRIIVWVSVFLVVMVVAIGAWQTGTKSPTQPATQTLGSSTITDTLSPSDWKKGSKNPKVTLIEYSDFQCPACGYYYPLVEKITTEYADRMTFAYRHFPLPQHKNALVAAYATEAAGKQGKFWAMYQKIFETQDKWSETNTATKTFEGYAQGLGLDMNKYKQDASSAETKAAVDNDRNTGLQKGVNGTPSFFLNGKKMQNPRDYTEFKALIEYAIAHP